MKRVTTFQSPYGGDENGVVAVFMDKVDWDYEVGAAMGGNRVYPSIEDLKRYQPCCEDCGIVEVEMRLKQVIDKGKGFGPKPGRREVRVRFEGKKQIQTVGTINDQGEFIADDPQPSPERYVRGLGFIKKFDDDQLKEFLAFCEKFGIETEVYHE